jgi:ribosomal protein L37AE/L43A
MDNRPVISVTPEAYWFCPECNTRNEETVAVDISDLTCQSCGANYKNGGVIDIENAMTVTTEGLIASQVRCIRKYIADFLQESPDCPHYDLGDCEHKQAVIIKCDYRNCPLQ